MHILNHLNTLKSVWNTRTLLVISRWVWHSQGDVCVYKMWICGPFFIVVFADACFNYYRVYIVNSKYLEIQAIIVVAHFRVICSWCVIVCLWRWLCSCSRDSRCLSLTFAGVSGIMSVSATLTTAPLSLTEICWHSAGSVVKVIVLRVILLYMDSVILSQDLGLGLDFDVYVYILGLVLWGLVLRLSLVFCSWFRTTWSKDDFWPTVLSFAPLAHCVVCLSSVCLSVVCDVLYPGKMAGPICRKFSEKVWTDHGMTWLHFGSIRRNRAMPRY